MSSSTPEEMTVEQVLTYLSTKIVDITGDWSIKHQKQSVAVERSETAIKEAIEAINAIRRADMEGLIDGVNTVGFDEISYINRRLK